MIDPVSTAASALTITERLRNLLSPLFRRKLTEPFSSPFHDIEMLPRGYRIDLLQQVPFVEVEFYAINYLKKPITLFEATIAKLQFSGGPAIESIPLSREITIPAHNTWPVSCRRILHDSEARALSGDLKLRSASYEMAAKARHGRHQYTFGPVSSRVIDGEIIRPRSSP